MVIKTKQTVNFVLSKFSSGKPRNPTVNTLLLKYIFLAPFKVWKNCFCRGNILLKMSTILLEPFLVRRHPLHQNEVLLLNDRSSSPPAISSTSTTGTAAEVSASETSVLCAVRRMLEAPAGSKRGEERVRVVDGGTLGNNVKEEKGSAGRGGSHCKEKTTATGGSEQRSFREKILAFEEFSSQNTGQKGCSRRWARPFSSSSSASKTFGNLSSTETVKDTDKKRDTKDTDNGNNTSAPEAEQTTQQQVEDGNDDTKTSKPRWTVRLSQRLMKIRGKLEQRCHSEHRTQTTKPSKQGIGSSVVSGSSLSNVFQMESSFTNYSSPSNQDRGLLISRSCSELNQADGSNSLCTESELSSIQNEKSNAAASHGKSEIGVHFTMAKHHTPSSSSSSTAAAVESATTGDEMAEDGKSKQNGTKSSFISELRRFYDRSCSDKKSVQRRFFKTSKKNKQVSRCEDASDAGTYIEADRIDRDILISNSAGPITSNINSTTEETKNETAALMRDVCDVQVTQSSNIDDSKDLWSTDRSSTPASDDKNERRPTTVAIEDNSEKTTVVTENNYGTIAIASNGKSERNIRAAREDEVIIETEAKTDNAVDALNGRRYLYIDREIESAVKNKKQVTPVPWRKPLSPPPPLAVFSASIRDPAPELHCKAIVEERRLSESTDNRMISSTGRLYY